MWSIYNNYNMKNSSRGIKAFGDLNSPLISSSFTHNKSTKVKFNNSVGFKHYNTSQLYIDFKSYVHSYNNIVATIQQNFNGIPNNYYTKMNLKNKNAFTYSNPKKAGSPVHLNLNSVPIFEFNIKSDNSICNKGDENNNRRVDWKAVNTFIVN